MCKDLLGFVMFSLLWPLHRICPWHTHSKHWLVAAGCQNSLASYHLIPRLQFVRVLGNPATRVNAVKPYLYLFLKTCPLVCQTETKRFSLIGIWGRSVFMAQQSLRIRTSPVNWSRGFHFTGGLLKRGSCTQRGSPAPQGKKCLWWLSAAINSGLLHQP